MDLISTKNIKELLAKYNAKPSKGLGQNFLIDKNIFQKIIDAGNLKPDDIVLEVGPGIGNLTLKLAEKVKKVIAVEKDKLMIEILKETVASHKNIEVVNADILKHSLPKNYKVVANIPYYLTSPLIRKLLEDKNPPLEIVLMIQKEVAQRICAKPPKMNLLASSVQFYARAEIISYVSKNCFWPSPKVDSAIIKIVPENKFDVAPDLFFKVVKAGFSQPRKQLVNNLTILKNLNGVKLDKYSVAAWLLKNNLQPNARAQTLTINDWINLAKNF
jgi:16S rRNA (adenine1518-N6/adenine1519-N6)-dimethyltransferase